MGALVEKRLISEGRNRADRDLSAPLRVTLDVAVPVLKLDSLDSQRLEAFCSFHPEMAGTYRARRL
jgi:hypothetical protein